MEDKTSQSPFLTPESNKKSGKTGTIIALAIIILLLVIAGFYFFNQTMLPTEEALVTNEEEVVDDNLSNIEADLAGGDFNEIDEEIEAIDAEFTAQIESEE